MLKSTPRRLGAMEQNLQNRINPNLIALDADGVLLDYHHAYAQAWSKAFGGTPTVLDPLAYWPKDRYGFAHLSGADLAHFRSFFDLDFWSTIPAMPGAIEACKSLARQGYDLVCLTAIKPEHRQARIENLQSLGFPIREVISAHGEPTVESPKARALRNLMPAAFVDDYLPYLRGAPDRIHCALIARSPHGTPNTGPEMSLARSIHGDLLEFSNYWIAKEHP